MTLKIVALYLTCGGCIDYNHDLDFCMKAFREFGKAEPPAPVQGTCKKGEVPACWRPHTALKWI